MIGSRKPMAVFVVAPKMVIASPMLVIEIDSTKHVLMIARVAFKF